MSLATASLGVGAAGSSPFRMELAPLDGARPQVSCSPPALRVSVREDPSPRLDLLDLAQRTRDLDLALSVAQDFRVKHGRAREIIDEVRRVVNDWRSAASALGLSTAAQDRMSNAFRVAAAAD